MFNNNIVIKIIFTKIKFFFTYYENLHHNNNTYYVLDYQCRKVLFVWWSKLCVCRGPYKGYEFKLLNCYNTWSLSQKRWFNVFIMLLIYAIFNKKGLENHITTYIQFNIFFLHLQLLNLLQDSVLWDIHIMCFFLLNCIHNLCFCSMFYKINYIFTIAFRCNPSFKGSIITNAFDKQKKMIKWNNKINGNCIMINFVSFWHFSVIISFPFIYKHIFCINLCKKKMQIYIELLLQSNIEQKLIR